MNSLIAKGNWNIVKGRLRQKYSQLTDNDLQYVEGHEEELIGRIQKATGERREELERFLREAAPAGSASASSTGMGTGATGQPGSSQGRRSDGR